MNDYQAVFDDASTGAFDVNGKEFEHRWELVKVRFEYAWRYFDFHASQRTTMLNFFIVFSGFFVAACVTLLDKELFGALLPLSVIGTLITIIFLFLERRNEELVHIAEEVLRTLENEVLFKDVNRTIKWPKKREYGGKMVESEQSVPIGIFVRQDYDEDKNVKSRYSHGYWIPKVIGLIGFCYVVLAIYSDYELSFYKLCI